MYQHVTYITQEIVIEAIGNVELINVSKYLSHLF